MLKPVAFALGLLLTCAAPLQAQQAEPTLRPEGAIAYTHLDSLYALLTPSMDPVRHFADILATSPASTEAADALTALLLTPGYLSFDTTLTADATRPTSMAVDWGTAPPDHLEKLKAFRSRHTAIPLGVHQQLQEAPYTFHRKYQYGAETDDVIVVMGASGRTRINVSHVFPDNTALREAYTGKIAIVSYGLVTFTAPPAGLLLLEAL